MNQNLLKIIEELLFGIYIVFFSDMPIGRTRILHHSIGIYCPERDPVPFHILPKGLCDND